MSEQARRLAKDRVKGMSPEQLRAEIARCDSEAETWKRHDHEFGSDIAGDRKDEADEYRRELLARGEKPASWKGEQFCGHEVAFADDGGSESGLELA